MIVGAINEGVDSNGWFCFSSLTIFRRQIFELLKLIEKQLALARFIHTRHCKLSHK